MPMYEVHLVRSFVIKIQAESDEDAKGIAEFFLGYSDKSNEFDRKKHKFSFEDIEMTENDAFEAFPVIG